MEIEERIIYEVLDDLRNRYGIGDAFDECEEEILEGIKEHLINVVSQNLEEIKDKAWRYEELSK